MTGKKAKEPRSLEEILRLSAKERARIVVNYSVNAEYNLPQEITEEDYRDITRSLYRSSREELALKKAKATAQEMRELYFMTVGGSLMAQQNIEAIRRLRLQGDVMAYLDAVKASLEERLKLITGGEEEKAEIWRRGYDWDIAMSKREALEVFGPIIHSLEQNAENIAPDTEAIETNLKRLQEAVNIFYTGHKGARLVMSSLSIRITAYTLKLDELLLELKRKLKTLPDKIEPQITEEELKQFVSNTLEAIEGEII